MISTDHFKYWRRSAPLLRIGPKIGFAQSRGSAPLLFLAPYRPLPSHPSAVRQFGEKTVASQLVAARAVSTLPLFGAISMTRNNVKPLDATRAVVGS